MTDRERLIELLRNTLWGTLCDHCGADRGSEREKVLEVTADYLLEHGVIVPPCKVGDTVYQIDTERIYESKVRTIIYGTSNIAFDERAIGKIVFLTREEAERALKGQT